ncbi:MAG: hypothetical protein MUC41_06200 [Syntrophobacteraceae bacterium]|nr:hypothetical protein [Syntrophobacteraceae bacterium]
MKVEKQQSAPALLSELRQIVRQISEGCADRSKALNGMLREFDARLSALRNELVAEDGSRGAGTSPSVDEDAGFVTESNIIGGMKDLDAEIQKCMNVLGRRMIEVETELSAIRQSQKALQAYRVKS